jgi:hypothetical protein
VQRGCINDVHGMELRNNVIIFGLLIGGGVNQ